MGAYTVKQVASLTGVPATTLRAWERRYGVVSPARTESRYRHYTDDEVARLRRMADLIADGTPASLAAGQVRGQPPADLTTHRITQAPPTHEFTAAAAALDADRLESVLADAFSSGDFEDVVQTWLFPALQALGDEWERGELDVASEHFASAAVVRRLAGWFEGHPVPSGAPIALVGLPAGADHQIATLAFATCLRRQGIDVRYLSTDVPRPSWLLAVATARPHVCVVGVPTAADAEEAAALVDLLLPHSPVWVGGRGADVASLPEAVTVLDDALVAGALRLAASLRTAAAPLAQEPAPLPPPTPESSSAN